MLWKWFIKAICEVVNAPSVVLTSIKIKLGVIILNMMLRLEWSLFSTTSLIVFLGYLNENYIIFKPFGMTFFFLNSCISPLFLFSFFFFKLRLENLGFASFTLHKDLYLWKKICERSWDCISTSNFIYERRQISHMYSCLLLKHNSTQLKEQLDKFIYLFNFSLRSMATLAFHPHLWG